MRAAALAGLAIGVLHSEAALAFAPEGTRDESPRGTGAKEDGFRFLGFPVAGFNSDEGFGLGAVLALYHYAGGVEPFRDDVSLRLYVTSALVQRHELRWEALEAFDLPLRFRIAAGLFSTVTQNFCGYGSIVTCDPALAERYADALDLAPSSEERAQFVRRFYRQRYLEPYADSVFRWRIHDKPHRVELMTGWRLAYHQPGQLGDLQPFPGSLYARAFPQGEEGLLSTPQLGVVLDGRDFEPAPRQGYLIEASMRASGPFTGSPWTYGGLHGSAAGYFELARVPEVVLAARVLGDLLLGDAPTEAQGRVGGMLAPFAFGGQWLGRGVRERRFIGKIKLIHQGELRAHLGEAEVEGTTFDIGVAWFYDVAFVGHDWGDLSGVVPGVPSSAILEPRPLVGFGVGARVLLNDAFLVRVDFAVSPSEALGPYLYTPVGNAF